MFVLVRVLFACSSMADRIKIMRKVGCVVLCDWLGTYSQLNTVNSFAVEEHDAYFVYTSAE